MTAKVLPAGPLVLGAIVLMAAGGCGARTGLPSYQTAFPPFDAAVPPIDAAASGVAPAFCADAGTQYIYVVTSPRDNSSDLALLAFDPTVSQFHRIGALACPVFDSSWVPFSMAADHYGDAYVLYSSPNQSFGLLYRVSTTTSHCDAVPFIPGQSAGFNTFGMGFAASADGTHEMLYVAGDMMATLTPGALGVIDTSTYTLIPTATFSPSPPYDLTGAELTGTGDGRLFAFWSPNPQANAMSNIAQIDPATARVVGNDPLPGVIQGGAWAFSFFGGKFYLFTDPNLTGSTVTEFDPSTRTTTVVATTPDVIVGAGVSACAPQGSSR